MKKQFFSPQIRFVAVVEEDILTTSQNSNQVDIPFDPDLEVEEYD